MDSINTEWKVLSGTAECPQQSSRSMWATAAPQQEPNRFNQLQAARIHVKLIYNLRLFVSLHQKINNLLTNLTAVSLRTACVLFPICSELQSSLKATETSWRLRSCHPPARLTSCTCSMPGLESIFFPF